MSYRIVDEPSASGLARFAVRPFWPLLAQMLAGAWLAWPWFIVNSIAMGSATRKQEQRWVAIAAVGSVVVTVLVMAMLGAEAAGPAARYVVLVMLGLKLGVAYWLHTLQERTFGLFEHFGHKARSGLALVIAGAILRATILPELPLFLMLVLS
ncbi:hypothetical protein [Sandaracinus amylolyticus]|uniref:Uncharacterized protein n=1 Tax=Sandaracinus amylolyticus TaxID=927083 RepID=A0A0F6YMB5_9BACT|nr:hypothetical protein [Sandaracinus amylolyticus]AKF10576.1 hypothetical protein DB32_007725 [Sandaracinus amylolyticus]